MNLWSSNMHEGNKDTATNHCDELTKSLRLSSSMSSVSPPLSIGSSSPDASPNSTSSYMSTTSSPPPTSQLSQNYSLSLEDSNCPPTKKRRTDIQDILKCIRSLDRSEQFELWKQMLETHPFDLNELEALRSTIDDRFKFDIISWAPYEIAQQIMSYLSPKDLCQAALVCRSWRVVCEDNRLWREKCDEEGLITDNHGHASPAYHVLFRDRIAKSTNTHQNFAKACANEDCKSGDTKQSISKYKAAYLKHMEVLRNWQTRSFEIKEPFIAPKTNPGTPPTQIRRQTARVPLDAAVRRLTRSTLARPAPVHEQPANTNGHGHAHRRGPSRPHDYMSPSGHLMQLRCHEDSVITCLQFNVRTNTIVSGSDDHTLKVWSAETGRCIRTLEGHTGGVWSSQLSDDDIVISGATDRTLRVWQGQTGELLHTLYGHASTVRCLALNGDKVVSGSRDTTLRLWDYKKGTCLLVLMGHTQAVRCVEFKGNRIVSGAYDHLVMVWNATTGVCLHSLECHYSRIYSLQFDGRTIASGSLDSTICLWDADTGKLRHHLEGHTSLTSKMQLKDDILVSANADSFCKVWDVNTGKCLRTFGGEHKHSSAITSVYFDNKHAVTSSDDGTVKLWNFDTGDFIRDLIVLPTAANGGVVWRIRASYSKLICAVGSRVQNEDTHLLLLDFE